MDWKLPSRGPQWQDLRNENIDFSYQPLYASSESFFFPSFHETDSSSATVTHPSQRSALSQPLSSSLSHRFSPLPNQSKTPDPPSSVTSTSASSSNIDCESLTAHLAVFQPQPFDLISAKEKAAFPASLARPSSCLADGPLSMTRSPELRQLILKMLKRNPKERPTAAEILQHSQIQKAQENRKKRTVCAFQLPPVIEIKRKTSASLSIIFFYVCAYQLQRFSYVDRSRARFSGFQSLLDQPRSILTPHSPFTVPIFRLGSSTPPDLQRIELQPESFDD